MKRQSILALSAAFLISLSAFAVDTVGTTSDDPARDAAVQSSPRPSVKGTRRVRISNTEKRRAVNGKGKSGGEMPALGSPVTGSSSASPGGYQTTPYGNP